AGIFRRLLRTSRARRLVCASCFLPSETSNSKRNPVLLSHSFTAHARRLADGAFVLSRNSETLKSLKDDYFME
ncbi:hypothetical protein CHARACLAT_025127, partial [Characodon lateralis]|nr:hypothetical protein [Characodon lateralis]